MTFVADVVVVGSGAGGGVVAKELAEAGLSVVLLDAGRRFIPDVDYPTDRPDFEVVAANVFAPKDPRRDTYTTSKPFLYNRVKGIGGSTLHYQGVSGRLHESDFRTRSQDGVGTDWPITYGDLEPFYARVEHELGVAGLAGVNPFDSPRSGGYPTPPHEFDLMNLAIGRGAGKLGLHLGPSPTAAPTKPWLGRPACVAAGTCTLGCRAGSKSSIDTTYIARAEATGRVSLRPESMAQQITLLSNGRVRGVVYTNALGGEEEARGRAVVVAGNAVETPRLLLQSASAGHKNGLANSSGLVGKYFTEHLAVFAWGLLDERVDPWRGVPTKGLIQDYYETSSSNAFARGWSIATASGGRWPLNVARSVGGWGTSHKRRMQEVFGHTVALWSVGEQLADPANSVSLDPLRKDCFGLPAPRLANDRGNNDESMLTTIPRVLSDLLEASGARQVRVESFQPGVSSHYMGTCRMGTDAKSSVVDAWCRSHDIRNLFIGDGSVMVTAGGVNPALTISALATRTAAGIIDAFATGNL